MCPYVDPQTIHNPATGGIAPATWGDGVRDAVEYLARNRPHARVYHSANQSIATGTPTALAFDSERVDVGGMHDTVTNNSRLTIPTGEAGFYHIGGCVRWAYNTTGYRSLDIRVGGTSVIARTAHDTLVGSAIGTDQTVGCDYQLAAGNYVELFVTHNAGAALNVSVASPQSPEFWCHWVSL